MFASVVCFYRTAEGRVYRRPGGKKYAKTDSELLSIVDMLWDLTGSVGTAFGLSTHVGI